MPKTDATTERVLDCFIRRVATDERMRFYAILDCARDEKIHPALSIYKCEYRCLLPGRLPAVLEKAAPHIVQVDFRADFARWLIQEGWGRSWGIYLASPARLDVLKNHFRGLVRVRNQSGRILYFRYYDPRVMRVYLPTCTAGELDSVFGRARCFFVEGEDPDRIIEYRIEDASLGERVVDLNG